MDRRIAWTLRKKVLIGYGLALCLIIAVIVWSLINMVRLGKAAEAILKENYKSILAAESMIGSLGTAGQRHPAADAELPR